MATLGIILAGGKSTRLYPATYAVSKQLLPIYDKPLIYYPLSTLMLGGIRDILLIVNPHEKHMFERLFDTALIHLGINVQIVTQENPNGIAEALVIAQQAKDFYKYDSFALILGDNLFHGATLTQAILNGIQVTKTHATIFAQKVPDLHRFGVVSIDKETKEIFTIVEKPKHISVNDSNYAIAGLYLFPKDAPERSSRLKPSKRNEFEITDLIAWYFSDYLLSCQVFPRGISWFDTGTPDSLLDAAHYVKTIQTNQGFLVGSPHEIALKNDWVDGVDMLTYIRTVENSGYGKLLNEAFING